MRGNDLLDKMELVDPVFVEKADEDGREERFGYEIKTGNGYGRWLKWTGLAACICLLVGLTVFLSRQGQGANNPGNHMAQGNPEGADTTDESQNPATEEMECVYNPVIAVADASRLFIPGYFKEELSTAQLADLIPDRIKENQRNYKGNAGFDGEGKLVGVFLEISSELIVPNPVVQVHISKKEVIDYCYSFETEPQVSKYNNIDFKIYQWNQESEDVLLEGEALIHGYRCRFTFKTTSELLEEGKKEFEHILAAFANHPGEKFNLDGIKPTEIPEYRNETMSLEEAKKDESFGVYMPASIPDGFWQESVRRYVDQNENYLSGLWTKGYAQLSWKVSYFTEGDKERLTSVEEVKNYDLSLYPIPRAESVPHELMQIVDDPIFLAEELTMDAVYKRAYIVNDSGDTRGWRMNFSVKYGDILVKISTKGVEPEWIYDQLNNLAK